VFSVGCSRYQTRSEVAISSELKAYAACDFSDGLQIAQIDPLAPDVTARTVDTAKGPKQVAILSGARIMFAYPNTDFYANVKVEKLPAAKYPQLKQILIENLEYPLTSLPSVKRNTTVAKMLVGMDAYGIDRDRLEGGTIGIYLLFDNRRNMAITIYFLNQDPSRRKFQTLDEYRRYRDHFLLAYASCIPHGS
jgi:hypothetical protein